MVLPLPETVEPEELDSSLPDEMRISVADLMFAWGAYDSAITYWLAKTLGMPLDVASIMFGTMPADTKLTKLKTIFEHYGIKEAAQGLRNLKDEHQQRVMARNAVAHSRCAGRLKNQPDHYAFSSILHIKGDPGMMGLAIVPLAEVRLSAGFADQAAREIMILAAKTPTIISAPHPNE